MTTPWNPAGGFGFGDLKAQIREERAAELRAYFAFQGVWEWIMCGTCSVTLGPSAEDGAETYRRFLTGARRLPVLEVAAEPRPGSAERVAALFARGGVVPLAEVEQLARDIDDERARAYLEQRVWDGPDPRGEREQLEGYDASAGFAALANDTRPTPGIEAAPPLPGFCRCSRRLPMGGWPHAECPRCRRATLTDKLMRESDAEQRARHPNIAAHLETIWPEAERRSAAELYADLLVAQDLKPGTVVECGYDDPDHERPAPGWWARFRRYFRQ